MALPSERSQKESNYLKKSYLLWGSVKSGKSTIAAQFGDDDKNKVLFFPTERGHAFQSIYKYEVDGNDPTKWEHFLDCAKELLTTEHDFKCLVIDIADNLWKMCSDHSNKKLGITHESEEEFGKGWTAVKNEFEKPFKYLTSRGIGIIFISHGTTTQKDLGKRKINYSDSTLSKGAKSIIHGMVDYIFYFGTDDDGNRYIRTKGDETICAGDRSGILPALIPMDAKKLISMLQWQGLETKQPASE